MSNSSEPLFMPPFLNKVADVRAWGGVCARVSEKERDRQKGRESMRGDGCPLCACVDSDLCCGGTGTRDTQPERWRGTRPERKDSWLAVGGLEL